MEALDPLCTKHYRYQLKDRKTLAAKGEPFTMSIHETFKVKTTIPNLVNCLPSFAASALFYVDELTRGCWIPRHPISIR